MGARWYSPTWAAFTARDTVFGTLQTPVTLNRYTYAGANPLAYWDPDGRSRRPLVDGVCSNGVRCYAAHEAVLRGAAVIADHIARDNFDDVIVEARRHDSFSREGGLQSAGDKGNRLEGWANQQQGGFARLTPRELFVLATNLDDDILDYAYEYQGLFIESDFDFSDFLIGGLNELTVGSANGLIGLAELGARHNPIARIDAKLPRIPDIPCRHQRSCELGALNGMVGETIVGGLALTRGTSLADDIATTVARRTTRVDDIAPHLDDATRLTQPATGGLPEALTAGRNSESGVHVYHGVLNGKPVYAGITNNPVRRAAEHGDRFALRQITERAGLTRGQARAVEESLIVRAGGVAREGGVLQNIRHSISPQHIWYQDAVDWGEAWLRYAGF